MAEGEGRGARVVVRNKRPSVRRDDEQLSPCGQCSTGLDESATGLFVLPIREQQQVALARLVDAPMTVRE
jgi:hypothetical protein